MVLAQVIAVHRQERPVMQAGDAHQMRGARLARAGLAADEHRARLVRPFRGVDDGTDVVAPDALHVDREASADRVPWGDGLRAGRAGRIVLPFQADERLPVGRVDLAAGGQQPTPVRLRPTLPVPVAPGRGQTLLGEHPAGEHGRGFVERVVQDAAGQVLQTPFWDIRMMFRVPVDFHRSFLPTVRHVPHARRGFRPRCRT